VTPKYGKDTVAATTTTTTPADQATTAAAAQVLLGVMDSVPEAEDTSTEKQHAMQEGAVDLAFFSSRE